MSRVNITITLVVYKDFLVKYLGLDSKGEYGTPIPELEGKPYPFANQGTVAWETLRMMFFAAPQKPDEFEAEDEITKRQIEHRQGVREIKLQTSVEAGILFKDAREQLEATVREWLTEHRPVRGNEMYWGDMHFSWFKPNPRYVSPVMSEYVINSREDADRAEASHSFILIASCYIDTRENQTPAETQTPPEEGRSDFDSGNPATPLEQDSVAEED